MSIELNISLGQKLALTPKILHTLKVLQMSSLELEGYLSQEALENPLIELELPSIDEADETLKELDIPYIRDFFKNSPRPLGASLTPLYLKQTGETLQEVLAHQLIDSDISPAAYQVANYLIENLDDSGYLDIPKEQIMNELNCSYELFEEALSALQKMDPAGIGASNLVECLLIQAKRLSSPSPALIPLIESYLDILPKTPPDKLAKLMNIGPCELKKAQMQLLSLNPKPGNGFSKDTTVPYIFPDLFVVGVGDGLRVFYNDFMRPKLEINVMYQSLLKTADLETKTYIQDKLIKAKDLLSSIDQRRSTVLSCAQAVLARQKAYFEHGAGHLAPMTLSDIADDIGVHKSTVSRAISGKSIQCSYGVLLLGDLFSRNISKDTEGQTQDMALMQIKKIIAEENPQKPLSDQKIAEELECIGVSISRRTVAKYRDMAGIATMGGRKRL